MGQGISLYAYNEINTRDYNILDVGKLALPNKIKYASRMSNNRMFVFSQTKKQPTI